MTALDHVEGYIRTLVNLGYTQKRIALEIKRAGSTISRILSRDQILRISEKSATALAAALVEVVKRACRERFVVISQYLKLTVLDCCYNEGTTVDEQVRAEVHSAMLNTLIDLFGPDPSRISLPPGVTAALASLGSGLYVIKLNPDETSVLHQLRLLKHELDHLIERQCARLPESKESYPPVPWLSS